MFDCCLHLPLHLKRCLLIVFIKFGINTPLTVTSGSYSQVDTLTRKFFQIFWRFGENAGQDAKKFGKIISSYVMFVVVSPGELHHLKKFKFEKFKNFEVLKLHEMHFAPAFRSQR